MNFFEHQDLARSKTRWLVVLFCLILVVLVLGTNLSVFLVIKTSQPHFVWQKVPELWAALSMGTIALILLGTWYKARTLSDGGVSVALSLGGRLVDLQTKDLKERQFLNIVSEMAIASGVPVPELFILDGEMGINAFAAGTTIHNTAIAITEGALKHFNRDELQGVIAHEFSHIFNGDMKLNMQLLSLIHGVFIVAHLGKLMNRFTGGKRSKSRIALVGMMLQVLGSLGVFFGRILQARVSRQREFLADASAVQFTRNPDGISSALKKIGGLQYGARLDHPFADEINHFLFAGGAEKSFLFSLATHPTLEERIKAIDPNFDGKYIPVQIEAREFPLTQHDKRRMNQVQGFVMANPDTIVQKIGTMNAELVRSGEEMLSSLPSPMKDRSSDPELAQALIYAMLLDGNASVRSKQLQFLGNHLSPLVLKAVQETMQSLEKTPSASYLSLLDLSLPALRKLSDPQFGNFAKALKAVMQMDQKVTVKEYAFLKIISASRPNRKVQTQYYSLKPLIEDVIVLLSALSYAGHGLSAEASRSFSLATQRLKINFHTPLEPNRCGLSELDKSLECISGAVPALKQKIIDACAYCVLSDRKVTEKEGDLLRAIASAIGCPVPLLTPAA